MSYHPVPRLRGTTPLPWQSLALHLCLFRSKNPNYTAHLHYSFPLLSRTILPPLPCFPARHYPSNSIRQEYIVPLHDSVLQLSGTTLPLPFSFHLRHCRSNSSGQSDTVRFCFHFPPTSYTTLLLSPCPDLRPQHHRNIVPAYTVLLHHSVPPLFCTIRRPSFHLFLRLFP